MAIPKIIHQTYPSREQMPGFLAEHIRALKALNVDWKHTLYDDADCLRFIRENYDAKILQAFQSIHPAYGAARADFFRYLLLYRVGGVYLDIKSGCRKPFDQLLRDDDEFLLSHWRDPKDGFHPKFGISSEFQQWHIMARAGHPFLSAVISHVRDNLRNYDPLNDGVGKEAVLKTTGPIAYTRAIEPLLQHHPWRLFNAEAEGVVYSVAPNEHTRIFRKHYSKVKRPLVRFAHIRKDYFSPRFFLMLLIYVNGRFYKFLQSFFQSLSK